MHIHLMMDCDSTQLTHCHTWTMWNILWPGHLQTCRDGTLTVHTPYSFTSPIIHFGSCNQFHVHMYISCWGPGEPSPIQTGAVKMAEHSTLAQMAINMANMV